MYKRFVTPIVLTLALALSAARATAQSNFQILSDFRPTGPTTVMHTADGGIFGTASGGPFGAGSVFALVEPAGGPTSMQVLHTFTGTDGRDPNSTLAEGPDGALYGLTMNGGAYDCGTAYRLTRAGDFSLLHEFTCGADGKAPLGQLWIDADGTLSGTTVYGGNVTQGNLGFGTVFSLGPDGSNFTTLYRFSYIDGAYPGFSPSSSLRGGVVRGPDGVLYGTTDAGGAPLYSNLDTGVLFSLDSAGFHILHHFLVNAKPALAIGPDGKVYGITEFDRTPGGQGRLFRWDSTGYTDVIQFQHYNIVVGDAPAFLSAGPDALYAFTSYGGTDPNGFAFKVTPDGTVTLLAALLSSTRPASPATILPGGDLLYVNTSGSSGSILRIHPEDVSTSTEFAFSSTQGLTPMSLVSAGDGTFYGTAWQGGRFGGGQVFRRLADGTFVDVYDFGPDGSANPVGLMRASDGNLYGYANGSNTIFKLTPSGVYSTLARIGDYGIWNVSGPLVEGPAGALYGAATYGGVLGYGSVFKVTRDGVFTDLLDFDYYGFGATPYGPVAIDADGSVLAATSDGGNGAGSVVKIDTAGNATVLWNFDWGYDGGQAFGGLVRAADGIYGTTLYGGNGFGNIFRLTPDGNLTTVVAFDRYVDFLPTPPLALAPDGRLFGAWADALFVYEPWTGLYSPLYVMNPDTDGRSVQQVAGGTDGRLYGVAAYDGPASEGTLFRVNVPPDTDRVPTVSASASPSPAEATSPDGALVTLSSAGSVDPDNDPLTVTWAGPFGTASGTTVVVTLPIGSNAIGVTVDDGRGGTVSANLTAVVQDTTPPALTLPSPINTNATSLDGASVSYTATALDAVDGSVGVLCSPASGSTFLRGATPVSCSATDAHGNTSTGTFTVNVFDTPPLAVDDTATTNAGQPVSIAVLANDTDPDGGSLSIVSVSAPAHGGTAIAPNGSITYTPAAGFTGTDSFTYQVTDNQGGFATATVTVTVKTGGLARFVALSRDNTWLRAGSTVVSGDVGAIAQRIHPNDRVDDDGDADDVTMRVGVGATMRQAGSRVVGDTVLLLNRSSVYDVVDNYLLNRHGTVLGTATQPMPLPFLALPAAPSVTPGTLAITVDRNRTSTLAAGRYGAVHVARGATLVLSGGLYQLVSLDLDANATVLVRGASEVRIKTELTTAGHANIVVDRNAGLHASDAVFYVLADDSVCARHDGDDDGDDAGPVSVHVGSHSVVQANVYAVNGTVWLQSGTQATGAFIGQHVRVGVNVSLTIESAFK
jgi:uncharacterized repeat protein (TIGR03803 family)